MNDNLMKNPEIDEYQLTTVRHVLEILEPVVRNTDATLDGMLQDALCRVYALLGLFDDEPDDFTAIYDIPSADA